jgi:AmmeMemoRadiSam system protein A
VLTELQRRALLDLARESVAARVAGHALAARVLAGLPSASGVFVTLKLQGHLRGCLGTLECLRDLAEDVVRCAADAASVDPRFSPVTPSQLAALALEISVLGPLERIDPLATDAIVIGCHGLVVESGRHRGVLLPQVATEQRWTAEQFMRQTCIKANLAPDAWRGGAVLYRFVAEVFGD